MKKSRTVLKNMKNNSQTTVVVVVVVVLILVGLYYLLSKNNMLGKIDGFTDGASLNNIVEKPNPGSNDVIVVLFYADWCPHCVSTKPEWAKLTNKLDGKNVNGKNVQVKAVNCEGSEVEKEVANDVGVSGYPTIKVMKNNENVEYNGPRNAAAIEEFVSKQCS
jgi:thiol-disulfide isomerase/thioredoxin